MYCNLLFAQNSGNPPNVYCLFATTVTITSSNDSLHIEKIYDQSKYSSSELEQYHFSFSSDITDTIWYFNCQYPPGPVDIQLWVTDKKGNQNYCETFINLSAPLCQSTICEGYWHYQYVGIEVKNIAGRAINDVAMSVFNQSEQCNPILTDEMGKIGDYYYFTNTLKVEKAVENLEGVSTLDLIRIGRHLLGIEELTSPYQLLAADIDGSGTITIADLQLLKAILLGEEDKSRLKWLFFPSNYIFSNPNQPFQESFEVFDMEGDNRLQTSIELLGNGNKISLIAVKVGDVDGSFQY